MKPIASALFGAVIVGGGWVSMAAPAFAETPSRLTAKVDAARFVVGGAITGARDSAETCGGQGHTHASTCTCARCSAAQGQE